jgi:lipopolysaccharide export system permease protein
LKSSRRSAGLGMGMFVFILYYVLMTAGRVFGEMGIVHPAVGLWAPNIIMGAGGLILLERAVNEKPTYLVSFMRLVGAAIRRVAKAWLRHAEYKK